MLTPQQNQDEHQYHDPHENSQHKQGRVLARALEDYAYSCLVSGAKVSFMAVFALAMMTDVLPPAAKTGSMLLVGARVIWKGGEVLVDAVETINKDGFTNAAAAATSLGR